jgi:hypothetical protein
MSSGQFTLERSQEPELGCFPGDRGVQVGLQVCEALLDESFPTSVNISSATMSSGV